MSESDSITPSQAVQYKPIAGFPGYRVGDDGSVWSAWRRGRYPRVTDQWRLFKPTPVSKYGYLGVGLRRDGKLHGRLVHRLVLEAFVGPCPEGMEGCHGPDPNPANNRASNLRWDSHHGNWLDQVDRGTAYCLQGEAHPGSVLTSQIVEQIMSLKQSEGLSAPKICLRLGLDPRTQSSIYNVLKGRAWNHVTGLPRSKPLAGEPAMEMRARSKA